MPYQICCNKQGNKKKSIGYISGQRGRDRLKCLFCFSISIFSHQKKNRRYYLCLVNNSKVKTYSLAKDLVSNNLATKDIRKDCSRKLKSI